MAGSRKDEGQRRPSKEETGIVNVEFYCTDSKILRPGNGSRRFDFNFYASKLFHSGFGTVSGAVQVQNENNENVHTVVMRWIHIIWMFLVCIISGALIASLIVVCLKRRSIDQGQDIIFILIGVVLIVLCFWSGAQFMKGCHSMGKDDSGQNKVLSGNQNMVQVAESV